MCIRDRLMPRALYWFRWGAAYTWITGVLLLGIVYYHGQQAFGPEGANWTPGAIVMIIVTFIAVFIYDVLWKSGLANNLRAAVIVSFILLSVVVALYVY